MNNGRLGLRGRATNGQALLKSMCGVRGASRLHGVLGSPGWRQSNPINCDVNQACDPTTRDSDGVLGHQGAMFASASSVTQGRLIFLLWDSISLSFEIWIDHIRWSRRYFMSLSLIYSMT